MDFVNDYKNEITYSALKRLQQIDEEIKGGRKLNYWDLIDIFGNDLWEFTNGTINNSQVVERNFLNLEKSIKKTVIQALKENNWIQTKTAKALGIDRQRLIRLIRKYKIKHKTWVKNK